MSEDLWIVTSIGTIRGLKRETAYNISAWGEPQHGWNVRLERYDGEMWHLSQLDHEPSNRWVLDAAFLANGVPHHVNGFGARYLAVTELTDEAAEELNQAIRTEMVKEARR